MTSSTNPIKPADVFAQADSFFRAIHQLHTTSPSQRGLTLVMVPTVVLTAFASELFLKCLVYLETGQTAPIKDHLLDALFKKLSADTQQRIRELWAETIKPRAKIFDALRKQGVKTDPSDLDACLATGGDAFRLVRYIYEGGRDFEFLLSDLPIPLRRVVLERKPEWRVSG